MRHCLRLAPFLALVACQPQSRHEARFYVSLERGNAVVAIEPASGKVMATYAAGRRPRGLRLSADGRTLFVAVSGSAIGGPNVDESKLPPPDRSADGIAMIDLASGRVDRVLKAGRDPETFVMAPDGRSLFVSNEDSGTVSAISIDGSAAPRSAKVGEEPEGIAVTGDGARLFVACEASDAVVILDARTLRPLRNIALEGRPRTLLLSRDGKTMFVAVEGAGKVAMLSAQTGAIEALIDVRAGDAAIRPMGMAELGNGHLLVTTGRGGSVLELDPGTKRIARQFDGVGARPWGIAVGAGGLVATANGPSDDITILDPTTGKTLARIKAGAGPWGVVGS